MENQPKRQPEAVGQTNVDKGRNGWRITWVLIGTAAACIIGFIQFTDTSSSRASTPAEIAAQIEFERKLIKSQEEFQLKIDAAAKETNRNFQ